MLTLSCIKKTRLFFTILVVGITQGSYAQPTEQFIKVIVAPDHADWNYKTGEKVKFNIAVLQNGNTLKNVAIKYEIGPEKMDPLKKDSLILASGTLTTDGGTMKEPGFLRCIATATINNKTYRGLGTAAFDAQQIQPAITNPADFLSYWEQAKAELATVPLDARMTLLPERCTEKVNVYHVNLQNFRPGTRLYGILCVPKKEGKYPAILKVPGAGARPYAGDIANAEKGLITFEIEDMGGKCKLTVIHDDFPPDSIMLTMVTTGWPAVLSSLKTLLETGHHIDDPV